ncbi:MAG TPA: helix-turn-helix domain-containing protein [Gemmatimonadales bacterium]|jgi:hypothetical protein|nr:helix-turn-helix domain-containing protein [Gemmatimonadales bacterium]
METTSARLSGLEPLLTIEPLAEYLDVPVTTIRDWRTDGKGPCAIQVGERVRFAVSGAVAERPLVRGGIGTAAGLLDAAGPQAVYKHASQSLRPTSTGSP